MKFFSTMFKRLALLQKHWILSTFFVVFVFACALMTAAITPPCATSARNIFCASTTQPDAQNISATDKVSALEQDLVYIVSANSACLYKAPSLSAQKVKTLKHKDEILLASPQKVLGEADSQAFWFFEVFEDQNADENADKTAYILCDLVAAKSQELISIPNYNAKTNSACALFEIVVDDSPAQGSGAPASAVQYQPTDIVLQKGTRIFLYQGYNRKSKFTAVALLRQNQVIYGYLQTETISPDGINPIIITCITLILAALGIIFAWMFMKRRKNVKLNNKYTVKLKKQ